jgi:hypothetical protein
MQEVFTSDGKMYAFLFSGFRHVVCRCCHHHKMIALYVETLAVLQHLKPEYLKCPKVLAAMLPKSLGVWDVKSRVSCRLANNYRHFEGSSFFHIQCQAVFQEHCLTLNMKVFYPVLFKS